MTSLDHRDQPSTVQQYIDEVPLWSDGTPASAGATTAMQRRIWLLASAGKFFEGLIVFMVGVALPLIIDEFDLSSASTGVITAAPLLGIMIGATALGGLSDRWGRRQLFFAEMVLFTAFLVGVTYSVNFEMLTVCLIGMGLALGCDYPTAHTMISETMPTSIRGRGVLAAFGFQAVGALAGTLIGVIILGNRDELSDWRWMFGVAVIPSVAVVVGRLFIVQSPHWLLGTGKVAQAELELKRLLARQPQYPTSVVLTAGIGPGQSTAKPGFRALFRTPWRRSTILASIPWFLQDLGTYGIGIFTPTIIAATVGTATTDESTVTGVVAGDLQGTEGAVLIDAFGARRDRAGDSAGQPLWPHQAPDLRFHRLRNRIGDRCSVHHCRRQYAGRTRVRRLHDVQSDDQPRTQLHDLPDGRRGLSHSLTRYRRGVGRLRGQGRRRPHRIRIPDTSRCLGYRVHRLAPRRDIATRRRNHLDFPCRHQFDDP